MDRLIGQEVVSFTRGNGIVNSVSVNGDDYNVTIEFSKGEVVFVLSKMAISNTIRFCNDAINMFVRDWTKKRICVDDKVAIEEIDDISHYTPINHYQLWGHNHGKISELKYRYEYGTRAYDIFVSCCKTFGWLESEAKNFAPQRLLYSKNAANGCSVWFVCNSNLGGKFNYRWYNIICRDDVILQEYINTDFYVDKNDTRIVFIKNRNTGYIFAGIYRQVKEYVNEDNHTVFVYKLIKKDYSKEKDV